MNIFYLEECPQKCARSYYDRHVVKMILETAQMLSTAHRVIDKDTLSDEFSSDSLINYRNYYINGKYALQKYTKREFPNWLLTK